MVSFRITVIVMYPHTITAAISAPISAFFVLLGLVFWFATSPLSMSFGGVISMISPT